MILYFVLDNLHFDLEGVRGGDELCLQYTPHALNLKILSLFLSSVTPPLSPFRKRTLQCTL